MPNARKILVVDDDRETLRALKARLNAGGFRVLTARDGQEGFVTAVENQPDAIVLDVRMPGLDGLTLLRKLRDHAQTRATPIVIVSASLVDQRRALELGARFFLSKPFESATLVAAIESAVAESSRADGQDNRLRRALIADDDRTLLAVLTVRLQQLGLKVRTTGDGETAMRLVEEERPDLVCLDVNMPARDGLSVCEHLVNSGHYGSSPVIVLTGRSDPETVQRCERLGAHYLFKSPGVWSQLKETVCDLLGIEEKRAQCTQASSNEPAMLGPSAPKVLVIDDDRDLCRTIELKLRSLGIRVLWSLAGMEGFRMALREQPAVIVTDFFMPDAFGNYVISRLKEHPLTRDIPVIVITGRTLSGRRTDTKDFGLERELLQLGAASYLSKPIDFSALLAELGKHIEVAGQPEPALVPSA